MGLRRAGVVVAGVVAVLAIVWPVSAGDSAAQTVVVLPPGVSAMKIRAGPELSGTVDVTVSGLISEVHSSGSFAGQRTCYDAFYATEPVDRGGAADCGGVWSGRGGSDSIAISPPGCGTAPCNFRALFSFLVPEAGPTFSPDHIYHLKLNAPGKRWFWALPNGHGEPGAWAGGFTLDFGGSSAPPPPTEKRKGKKALAAIDKTLNLAGNTIGLAAAIGLFNPVEPVITKATGAFLGILAATLKVSGSAIGFIAEAIDPPDSHYQKIATPIGRPPPQLRPGAGISASLAQAVNALSVNAAQLNAVSKALMTSIDRATGAAQAHDEHAREAQLRAAAKYATTAAALVDSGVALRRNLAQTIRTIPGPKSYSVQQLRSAQQEIASKGLPQTMVNELRGLGFSSQDIEVFRSAISQMNITTGLDLAHVLNNPTADADQHQAAALFRAQAKKLAQSSKPPPSAAKAKPGHYTGQDSANNPVSFDVTAESANVTNVNIAGHVTCTDNSSWTWTITSSANNPITTGLAFSRNYTGGLTINDPSITNINITYALTGTLKTAGTASGSFQIGHISWDTNGTHYDCTGTPASWTAKLAG